MNVLREIALMAPSRGYRAYRSEIDAAVAATLEGDAYILGPNVAAFEQAFGRWCGALIAVGVANGTDALHLALRTLGVGQGDAVFSVSHTAVATIAAIELAGATPVLVDVDPRSFTLDPQKLQDSIAQYSRSRAAGRPRAVIAVHLYGHPCDLDEIKGICDQHQLLLIEDCAQAHGARIAGKQVGSHGAAAAYSFYPTKNLPAFGDGGAVTFASAELAERCRALREYGWRDRYISSIAGLNSRLDELQAAILNVRLRYLDSEIATRRRIAEHYSTRMSPHLIVPQPAAGVDHAYHLYVAQCARRDEFRRELKKRGVATGVHYPVPVHLQPAYAGRVAIGAGGMHTTETLAQRIASLPMHPFLEPEEVEAVVAAVESWARQGGHA